MTLIFETLPPSTNNLYVNNPHGGRRLSPRAREAKDAIAWEARSQFRGKPLQGPVAMELTLYWPDRRKHDIDNIKALLDALTGIIYEDDGQIVDLHTMKEFDKERPRVEMRVWAL